MAEALAAPRGLAWQKLAAPILVIMVLAMMVLPMPPFLLDLLFTFNIALAMIVLLISLYTLKPLEFSVFPTVLLLTTLCAGALSGADEPSDSYSVLIETAADLRCKYMDGAADLCDRQLTTLLAQLGPDRFEEVLLEAQHRRRSLQLHPPELASGAKP